MITFCLSNFFHPFSDTITAEPSVGQAGKESRMFFKIITSTGMRCYRTTINGDKMLNNWRKSIAKNDNNKIVAMWWWVKWGFIYSFLSP